MVIGVPMYTNAAGIIPIVQALLARRRIGHRAGFHDERDCALAARDDHLRKVLKVRLIATFAAVVALGILLVGFVFNAAL